ncbi:MULTISPECIES: MFS transporter [unclassified Paenibacillus]|uniref:MFS transporter n=1 Tax=unclassified Paenibacillus TaxID=185978 RepID=UPI000955E7CF|nr:MULTISPECIES: MFS transporter [unclassified Paenibacillus]ASS68590.1 MFS transporter [Paenibacillus sp. RUD330]SIR64158.1 MFS transporter, FSR family, fosmidomycin resistance protein [Paenibacillus sp. RU4X]SIR72267.1 MFS transporter, FSR family, fosmidomycin resistance protein [Paenibacillus sp. RU4T]
MSASQSARIGAARTGTIYAILIAISAVHMLNDSMQSVIPALYPIFQDTLNISYTQIGWLTFTLQMTSSVMQPVVGLVSDRKPSPWMLPVGMLMSMIGMAGMAFAPSFGMLIFFIVFVGLGSAVFHPEGSRVVYFAAGGRRGFAQSIYQVGGNFGQSLAPLMTIFIFIPLGQRGAVWGTLLAVAAIIILLKVVPWYRKQLEQHGKPVKKAAVPRGELSFDARKRKNVVAFALSVLIFLVFARSWYGAAIGTFYQFYLIHDYGLSKQAAQVPLLLFMIAGVVGTFFGGMVSDRIGAKRTMLLSILGAAPFTLLLPHLPLVWMYPVAALIGLIIQASFSVSVVYAQELMPGRVGMASGLITGFAFGMGALGAVVLGKLGDIYGLQSVMYWTSVLPVAGALAFLLPRDRKEAAA